MAPQASFESSSTDPADSALRVDGDFERAARAGELIFEADEPGDALYVVQAGEVAVLATDRAGKPRLVARLGPGEAVGETDALLGRARSARAVALSDTKLLRIDRAAFREMCLERPDIAFRVVERLAGRVVALEERLAALGMNDLVRPVARGLLREVRSDGSPAGRESSLRSLARAAGLSLRETHRGLQELIDRKLARLVDDALVVPDRAALVASLDDEAAATGSVD